MSCGATTLAKSAQKRQVKATIAAVIATGECLKLCQTSPAKKRRTLPRGGTTAAGISGARLTSP